MDEYIKREDAINAICNGVCKISPDQCRIKQLCGYHCKDIAAIRAIPSADVVPVKNEGEKNED